jgi:hypothetical protein
VKPSPVRVKVPMVAMTVSCLSIGPRPSRPRWRSSGRGRAPTHPLAGRSAAEDGAGRLSCLARNARHAQGKKVAPAPLRPWRPRRQPSLGQIRPSEEAWRRDTGRTTETAGGRRRCRHKRDEPGIAVTVPMACIREDPAGTGEAGRWTCSASSRLGGVAWMFATRAALLRLSRAIPMAARAGVPWSGMAGEADLVPPLR